MSFSSNARSRALVCCTTRRTARLGTLAGVLALLLLLSFRPSVAQAGPILSLTLNPGLLTAEAGDTLIFRGTITNTTGVSLASTDLFLNFSGFDAASLTDIRQLLGTTSFVLPNNRSEEHTTELQSPDHLVSRLLLGK